MARRETKSLKALYFDLGINEISEMNESIPWLKSCVKKFEVTNIGANHDLTRLLAESIEDPE